jgi:hypothetical protein
MKVDDLFETPMSIEPAEFRLDEPDRNAAVARDVLKDTRKRALEKFGNGEYTLFELPRAFALVRHEQEDLRIVYYMQYKLAFHKFIGRQCAQQIAVWRDNADPFSSGIAKHLFFNYLLTNYKTVITDSMQTPDGQRFWDNRVVEALQQKLYVYYVNLLPVREITQIRDFLEYRQLKLNKQIWGDEQKHQARRIIVTTTPLE